MRTRLPDRRTRIGLALALAAGLGCRSTTPKSPTMPQTPANAPPSGLKSINATSGIKGDTGISRAEFHGKADADQQVGVHADLGRAHESQGQLEAAANDYQRALEALDRPGNRHGPARLLAEKKATIHRRLAGVLDQVGQFGQSDVHYKAALKLAPDDPKVWNNAGYSDYIQGLWPEAERKLRTASRLAPNEPQVATNLGLTLAALGRTDEALATMTKVIGPAAAHSNVGFVMAASGRRDEAADQYRKALALEPTMPVALAALTQLAKPAPAGANAPAALVNLPRLPDDPAIARASGSTSLNLPTATPR